METAAIDRGKTSRNVWIQRSIEGRFLCSRFARAGGANIFQLRFYRCLL